MTLVRRRTSHALLLLTACMGLFGITAQSAFADGTVTVNTGVLLFEEEGLGVANNLTFHQSGSTITIDDAATGIIAGAGCVQTDADTVDCALVTSKILVELGLGDDSVAIDGGNPVSLNMEVQSEDGTDNIQTGDGDDLLYIDGDGEVDTVNGGVGSDTVLVYPNDSDPVAVIGVGTVFFIGSGTTDLFAGAEELRANLGLMTVGGGYIDASASTLPSSTLYGSDYDDTLIGSTAVGDTIYPQLGADTIDGNDGGTDTVGIIMTTAETVTASDADIQGTVLGTKTVSEIDTYNINGSSGNDIISASAISATTVTINGNGGNDSIIAPAFGANADNLNGGGDVDTVLLFTDGDATLTDTTLVSAGTDNIADFENANLTGDSNVNNFDASAFTGYVDLLGFGEADVLEGSVGGGTLTGGSGGDTITGGAAADSIVPGDGDDTVDGGDGTDVIFDSRGNSATLIDSTYTVGVETDSLTSIEVGQFTLGSGNETLDASQFSGDLFVWGGQGADVLIGGDGDDVLSGEDGDDVLTGNSGANELNGNANTDTVSASGNFNITATDSLVSYSNGDSDELDSIEALDLTGGVGANTFDLSAFTGGSSMNGQDDADILIGGTGSDSFEDTNGENSFDGNGGSDTVTASGDVNFTLTDTLLTVDVNDNTLAEIEMATLTGGASANVLDASGFTGTANLRGSDGNDTLVGGAGSDDLDGGDDTDQLQRTGDEDMTLSNGGISGSGDSDSLTSIESAQLTGGSSNNTFAGSGFDGNITIYGEGGNDIIGGGGGGDTFFGGAGDDDINGRDGADTLNGEAGEDDLDGGGGADTLNGGSEDDRLDGGADNDALDGGADSDTISQQDDGAMTLTDTSFTSTTAGTDSLVSIDSAILEGGTGADTINASTFIGVVYLSGSDGNDIMYGGFGSDEINGEAGNDTLYAGNGNDTLNGGDGNDAMHGNSGNDRLNGNAGADSLRGDAGSDGLFGGTGGDRITGNGGRDYLYGQAGNDKLFANDGKKDYKISCGKGKKDRSRVDRRDPRTLGCETTTRG